MLSPHEQLRLETCLEYRYSYSTRPTTDPFVLLMRDANEREIAELEAKRAGGE